MTLLLWFDYCGEAKIGYLEAIQGGKHLYLYKMSAYSIIVQGILDGNREMKRHLLCLHSGGSRFSLL